MSSRLLMVDKLHSWISIFSDEDSKLCVALSCSAGNLTFLPISGPPPSVLFLQNDQINACPPSVQNNQICVKVLQQLGVWGGWEGVGGDVHLGLPGHQCECIASSNGNRWRRTFPRNSDFKTKPGRSQTQDLHIFQKKNWMLNGDISFKSWLYYFENTFQCETWREEGGEMMIKTLF